MSIAPHFLPNIRELFLSRLSLRHLLTRSAH
jgi:hypothetical protein